MCDHYLERVFRLEDDDAGLFSEKNFQQQVMEVCDDDDDKETLKKTFSSTYLNFSALGNTTIASANSFGKDAFAAAQLKTSEVNDLNAKFVPLQNVYAAPRTGEVMESHSISSNHSRGYAQLSSSGTQTPTHASNEDLLRGSALLTAEVPQSEVDGMSTTLSNAQDVAAMPTQLHHQDEFQLTHNMLSNQAKQTYGVMPVAQSGFISSRILPSVPSTTASRQSPFSCTMVGSNSQVTAANGLLGGTLQPRQVMMSQQGVSGAFAQPVSFAQIRQASQQSVHTIFPQSLLQQQQKQQQTQLFQTHSVQQQPQAQYVTGAVPSGYVQLLVQARSPDGSGGYQLMMVPAHSVTAQCPNGASAQLLQPHTQHVQNMQQSQHMHNQHHHHHHQHHHQQQQEQAIMQQVWPLPQQGHGQLQQLPVSGFANFAQTPQRCPVVSANGQQQYVMTLNLPQFQQMQQAQAQAQAQAQQQQQGQRHLTLPAQPNQQQHMGQQIYFANQQQQQQQLMFANPFSPSGMPLTNAFN